MTTPARSRNRFLRRLLVLAFGLPAAIAGAGITAIAAAPPVQAQPARMVFTLAQNGVAQVYTSLPTGQDQIKISLVPGANYSPSPSPDGKQVVFTNELSGVTTLYVANTADGSGAKRLTDPPALAGTASWSRDGKKLTYVSTTPGNPRTSLFLMNADGSGQLALTPPSNAFYSNPVFSADGNTIFSGKTEGSASTIHSLALGADGTPKPGSDQVLTKGPFDGYPLALDPQHVVFASRTPDGLKSILNQVDLIDRSIQNLVQGLYATDPHLGPGGRIDFTAVADGALKLAWIPIAGGTPTILPIGGGDIYNGSSYPLIATPVVSNPVPDIVIPAPARPATTRSGVHLTPWEVALGVVVVAGVAGGITYWVKLRPTTTDNCDPQRIARAAARAEFTAACTAMDQAEAAHNRATELTHQAEFRLSGYLDQGRGTGAQLTTAHADVDTHKAAQEAAYKVLAEAGLRQGAARLNVDVAEKRLADCERSAPPAAAAPPPQSGATVPPATDTPAPQPATKSAAPTAPPKAAAPAPDPPKAPEPKTPAAPGPQMPWPLGPFEGTKAVEGEGFQPVPPQDHSNDPKPPEPEGEIG